MKYITDTEIDRISGETGKNLSAEPKVKLIIAQKPGFEDTPWEGGINGHFFRIQRGVEVLVPSSIAALIMSNEQVNILSDNKTKAYKNGSGKKLSA
ncbi:MAG: hypothetical protein IJO48_02725 [Clostridia bacterium]|nr:hypothetical protein [Clostridia bacterium]